MGGGGLVAPWSMESLLGVEEAGVEGSDADRFSNEMFVAVGITKKLAMIAKHSSR